MEENNKFKPLEFKGSATEYFKIYIVNLFLSIITLGIYSAWAKVRKNRYLYSNTYMEGTSFEYTANPINILKGRLLVVGGYILFILVSDIFHLPIIAMVITLAFIIFIPYIIHLALKFRLRYVRYRGINFSYKNKTSKFYEFYIINILILNALTLGLAGPHNTNRFFDLYFNNAYFSDKKFQYEGKSWPFYKMWIKAFGLAFVLLILGVLIVVPITSSLKYNAGMDPAVATNIAVVMVLGIYAFMAVLGTFFAGVYFALQSNYVYEQTDIEDIAFKSEYKALKMGWIYFTNFLAVVLSFGLLGAWATIRLQKYKVENFYHTPIGDMQLQRVTQEQHSSFGEESSEFFDMDLG